MKVVLNKNIPGVGRRGEVLSVKDGYYRNFLLPNALALVATVGRLKEVEARKEKRTLEIEKVRKNAKEIAGKLSTVTLTITAKVTSKNTLYASIGAHEIADALKEQAGMDIDSSLVQMSQQIKSTGNHSVKIKLNEDTEVEMQVMVKGSRK